MPQRSAFDAVRAIGRTLPDVEDLIGMVYGSADFRRGVANFLSGNKTLPGWTGE